MTSTADLPVSGAPRALPSRLVFVVTILAGSFLLFLVQPMVARMALPRLGGAPNVWNSAMLVYQALLLAGYGYAHWLGRFALARQAQIHIGVLVLAGLTLPIALADLPPALPGTEALWVPLLFLLSVGPVFFAVSAQAPLMQRWFAADPRAGEPWALYAASNLGSFVGLLAYPLVVEPGLRLEAQSALWAAGYGLLLVLVTLAAWSRRGISAAPATAQAAGPSARVPARRIALWLALSAVPSGLMLSTTTHLTTDVFAMPLLWVIPLGLYLLSFVFAFSDRRGVAGVTTLVAPSLMLLAGGLAMTSRTSGTMVIALAGLALLFAVCVALHARLYAARPDPSQLTLFYLVMSAGGALGGLFTALIAPMVFDWAWEHPLLVLAAAMLLPLPPLFDWRRLPGLSPDMAKLGVAVVLAVIAGLAWELLGYTALQNPGPPRVALTLAISFLGLLLVPWRAAFLAALAMLMLAQGGLETASASAEGLRTRSYFGIYTVRDDPVRNVRYLTHGTTLHGQQSLDPARRRELTTYYGPGSGVGLALTHAQALYGPGARIGVVGLGAGTLACYARPGESWRFYEIDPAVLALSRDGTFSYLDDCTPQAPVVIGDARLELAREPAGSIDVLAVDAFSSDAIPLHLLTHEAFGVYLRALSPSGILLVHISNRYIELEPVLAAEAKRRGLAVLQREDIPSGETAFTASTWVLMTRDPARLDSLRSLDPSQPWTPLLPAASESWTDDYASILPHIRWRNLIAKD